MSFGVQGVNDPFGAAQQGTDPSTSLRPFANLDLSSQQRTQIRQILGNAKSQGLSQSQVQSQIDGVLTPQQQQTMQTDLQQSQGSSTSGHHHHHGHHGGGQSSAASASSDTTTTTTPADPWDPDQTG